MKSGHEGEIKEKFVRIGNQQKGGLAKGVLAESSVTPTQKHTFCKNPLLKKTFF